MAPESIASQLVLIGAAALLLYVALTDLRQFRIRNGPVVVLGVLFFLHAMLSGRWVELHWNVGFASLAFSLMLLCYTRGMMGGGDLKLMTVALLWSGAGCAIPFLVILVTASLLHTLAVKLGLGRAQRVNGRTKIPFGPSICAGLIGIFLLGCLRPI